MVAINDETSIQSTLLTRLMGGTRNFGQMLDMLPEPIKNAVNQFNQLIKVGLRFIATPIGMVVTTLALAFKSLHMYMANTSDGQMVMAKATGYAEGVFNRLTKSVYDFIRGIRGIGQAAADAGKGKPACWVTGATILIHREIQNNWHYDNGNHLTTEYRTNTSNSGCNLTLMGIKGQSRNHGPDSYVLSGVENIHDEIYNSKNNQIQSWIAYS